MRSLLLGAGLRGLRGGLCLTRRLLAFRIPTVLLNIWSTWKEPGDSSFEHTGHRFIYGPGGGYIHVLRRAPGWVGPLPAGQAPGGPWRACRNCIKLLGAVAICRRLLQRQALCCSAGQEPQPEHPQPEHPQAKHPQAKQSTPRNRAQIAKRTHNRLTSIALNPQVRFSLYVSAAP